MNNIEQVPTLATLPDVAAAIAGQVGPRPDATLTRGTGKTYVSGNWLPDTMRPLPETDTLFLPYFSTEKDILDQGGRLAQPFDTYFSSSTVKNSLVAGRWPEHLAFDRDSTGTAHCVFPLDGLLPLDQFTIEMQILSVGADFTAQPAGGGVFLNAYSDTPNFNYFLLSRSSVTNISAGFNLTNATGSTISGRGADLVLAAGDIPADTWKTLTCTWDGTVLTVRIGNNVKASGNGNTTYTLPSLPYGASDYGGGGLVFNGNPRSGGDNGPFRVSAPHIRRYARTPGAAILYKGPTLTVNVASVGAAFPSAALGVFAQYPGWVDYGADGSKGGGGVTPTSIRDQEIATQTAAGLKTVRIDHIFDKIGIVDNGAGATPRYTYDWSILDGPMDKLAAAGCQFHVTLGYTPFLLSGYTLIGGQTLATTYGTWRIIPPTSNVLFAQMCTDAVAHWIAKGYSIRSVGFWNEPSGGSFWNGNTTQFTALWGAVQQAIAAAYPVGTYPQFQLGTCEDGFSAQAGNYVKAVIDYAHTNSLPIAGLYHHDYSGSAAFVAYTVKGLLAYAVSQGFPSTTPVGITEWNYSQGIYNQVVSTLPSLAKLRDVTRDLKLAAYIPTFLLDAIGAGLTLGIFTRMGILDNVNYTLGSGEQGFGLMTSDDPPRPLPSFQAFSLLWKLSGSQVAANSNWPGLRTMATKTAGGVVTLFYSFYRPWRETDTAQVSLEWSGLPAKFTWKQWRVDRDTIADGRAMAVAAGDQTNLTLGVNLSMLGLGCIQITPTS